MNRTINSFFRTIVWVFLLASCANRVPPSGGPVDVTPPKVISAVPPNGSVNFKGNTFSLNFSEYVDLKDGGTGIFISPPMAIPPAVKLRSKTLSITFKEPLDSATTYTVTIGKSITDFTEGIALKDTTYVFSTGPLLDSLSLSGNVTDATTYQPVKDALVMLYLADEDSVVEKMLPRYFARTDVAGNYQIKNIRQGDYKAMALLETAADYKYNLPEEKIAFSNRRVQIDSVNTPGLNFRLFKERAKDQKLLKKSFILPGKLILNYSKAPDDWKLRIAAPSDTFKIFTTYKPGQDSIITFVPKIESDSVVFIAEAKTDGVVMYDTMQFNPKLLSRARSFKKGSTAPDTMLTITSNVVLGKIRKGDTLTLAFSFPVLTINPARIRLITGKDSIQAPILIPEKTGITSLPLPTIGKLQEGIQLYILPGAFSDIYGKTNDTVSIKATNYTEDELGTLEFTITTDSVKEVVSLVAELTDKGGKVIATRTVKPGEPLRFAELLPGNYGLRVVKDTNNDGKWTTGDFRKKIQPEEILFYPSGIVMRAGWDQELTWDLSETGSSKKLK